MLYIGGEETEMLGCWDAFYHPGRFLEPHGGEAAGKKRLDCVWTVKTRRVPGPFTHG